LFVEHNYFGRKNNITMSNTQLHIKSFEELTVDELYELLRVRNEVFVVEQDCVYQDMDGDDKRAIHVWLTETVIGQSEGISLTSRPTRHYQTARHGLSMYSMTLQRFICA
jgi:predicted GNAT family N-acyltransferase